MRNYIHIGEKAYSKEAVLLELELLHKLQQLALKDGASLSQTLNKVLSQALTP